jgi:hypothetical protein
MSALRSAELVCMARLVHAAAAKPPPASAGSSAPTNPEELVTGSFRPSLSFFCPIGHNVVLTPPPPSPCHCSSPPRTCPVKTRHGEFSFSMSGFTPISQ